VKLTKVTDTKKGSDVMANTIALKAQCLNQIDFEPFGQKLCHEDIDREIEPAGGILVIPAVGKVDVENGEPELNFIKVIHRPFICKVMERHLLTSQSFVPLRGCCGLMVLAPASEGPLPDLSKVVAVIFDGSEGININRGTWHTAPFAISNESNYIMAGRKGTLKNDLHLVDLEKEFKMTFQIVL
jgi:ureidoglycolate hydrolase